MKNWKEFLDSLATRGGSVFLLLLMSVVSVVATLVALKVNANQNIQSALGGLSTGFTSALLVVLNGKERLNGDGDKNHDGIPDRLQKEDK